MKNLILSTALILGATVPAVAQQYNAPGVVNQTALEVFAAQAQRADNGNDRAFSLTQDTRAASPATLSTRGTVSPQAREIFAGLARSSDNGATRALADNAGTLISGTAVNARAQAIFERLAIESDT